MSLESLLTVLSPVVNWRFGWWLILSGFLTGAILGLGFHKPEFLGGYGSFRRRLARLGHIAQEALGMINVLFGMSVWPESSMTVMQVACAGFIIGGVAMPTVCFLSAWREGFRHLFAIPVVALGTAVFLTALYGGVR